MKKLQGKVAVITGASKGLGASIAQHFAAEGASVVVNYSSSKEGADRVVAEITKEGGTAVAIQANVSKRADIVRLFEETKQAFGRLDILVNNAGVFQSLSLAQITEELFHRHFDLNVLGLLLTTQEAVKHFDPAGGGCIVNLSSIVSTLAPANASVYSATKAAVNAITKSLAKELGPRKIRVNAVAPGVVETEGTIAAGITDPKNTRRAEVESQTPLGRIGLPRDVAPVAVFLASDEAAWCTGETWFISGGFR
jgi:3-oxoacyl-[acyl-carrier protein] reductase